MRIFYKNIVLLMLVCMTCLVYSQTDKVVTLQQTLETVSGLEKVKVLNELSIQLKESDAKKAKDYAEEAYKLSKKLDFNVGTMTSAFFLGQLEKEAKHFKRAANKVEESVAAAQAAKDKKGELDGLALLKTIYLLDSRKSKWEETELAYRQLKNKMDLDMNSARLVELEKDFESKETALRLSERKRNKITTEKEKIEDELALTIEEKLIREAELAHLAQEKAELETKTLRLENEAALDALLVSEQKNELLSFDAKLKRQQFWQFFLLLGLVSTILIIGLLIRNHRLKRQSAMEKLQTQRLLLTQEKMATLGQLTAGIAHEIKNPLNFVNNFAEGSAELAVELLETLADNKAAIDPKQYELVAELAEDLKQNALDILDNGKRADRIVQSMMEHARGDKGIPQLTNINALTEDNLNLAYHGYRALYPSFNIDMQVNLDPSLPMMMVIPQDLSRVVLNILNNACYALNKKQSEAPSDYKPILRLSTQKGKEEMVIRIWDNGPGIPASIRAQIFNPFFTTKPSGEGNAGLGLSICYDIVVQGLGGKLEVESEVDQFTEFVIRLPLSILEHKAVWEAV